MESILNNIMSDDEHFFDEDYGEVYPCDDIEVYENGVLIKGKDFNDPVETEANRWDTILNVGSEKFYVLRGYIGTHADYFYEMLYDNGVDKEQVEFDIPATPEVTPATFQLFLEAINALFPMNGWRRWEEGVIDVLEMARVWNSPSAVDRCEWFLIKVSPRSNLEKFRISLAYNLHELKKWTISRIASYSELKEITTVNQHTFDAYTLALLIEKTLDFHPRSTTEPVPVAQFVHQQPIDPEPPVDLPDMINIDE